MSVDASRVVWAARIQPPTRKLVALALADCLNEKTGKLNPSLQTIGDMVGVTRGQAQRYVRDLIADGLVSVVANRLGGKPGVTPDYRLNFERFAEVTPTDGAHAAPTDGAGATPTDGAHAAPRGSAGAVRENPTDGVGAEEGGHGSRGGVAPTPRRGGMDAALTRKNQKEPEENQVTRADKPAAFARPDDVSEQVWKDWCALRKAKKATVSATAIAGARTQAALVPMSLEQFLTVWCARGSQGLEASWLKPSERSSVRGPTFKESRDYGTGVKTDGTFAA